MRTAIACQAFVHARYLNVRNLDRVVRSARFGIAFDAAGPDEKQAAWELIDAEDRDGLLSWIKRQLQGRAATYRIGELRALAKELHVTGYCHRSREELLSAVAAVPNSTPGPADL